MPVVTVSERGQVVIPQPIREKLDLRKGRRLLLEFSEADKTITLRSLERVPGRSLRGFLKGTNALELLEAEHRQEVERDGRR